MINQEKTEAIPSIAHIVWFGKEQDDYVIRKCAASRQAHLSHFEHRTWSEKDVAEQVSSPEERKMIETLIAQKRYAFASDIFRLRILHKFGGIYLDTDVEVVRPFDELLSNKAFFGAEARDRPNTAVFGSVKNHEFLQQCLEIIQERNKRGLNFLIAPELIKVAISRSSKDVRIYAPEYFYPYNPFDEGRDGDTLFYSDVTSKTFAIHHWNASWKLSFWDRLVRRLRNLREPNTNV
ncbi:glycosyltransferase [Sphingomonas sp.]|uniref:glycosyltransferase n=1 Tax=Sphingomonas sp. TaxID=28214 RepID=UPI0035C83C4B